MERKRSKKLMCPRKKITWKNPKKPRFLKTSKANSIYWDKMSFLDEIKACAMSDTLINDNVVISSVLPGGVVFPMFSFTGFVEDNRRYLPEKTDSASFEKLTKLRSVSSSFTFIFKRKSDHSLLEKHNRRKIPCYKYIR